jgi:anthranilate/para-aminobenzoate synthase component I
MEKEAFLAAVEETKEHIRAGDVFQLVLSQRFERNTFAEPFEIYRALRIVNPSPYMAYLQVLLPRNHTLYCSCRYVISVPCRQYTAAP